MTFPIGLTKNINNPVPVSQVRFQQLHVIEYFYVEGSNKRSDRGLSSDDLEFFIDCTVLLQRRYRRFRLCAN